MHENSVNTRLFIYYCCVVRPAFFESFSIYHKLQINCYYRILKQLPVQIDIKFTFHGNSIFFNEVKNNKYESF